MLRLTSITDTPSERKVMATEFSQKVIEKALREKPWITKTGPDSHRVVPRTADHGKYELTHSFDADGLPVIHSCVEERTGEPCKGFHFTGNCYHSASLAKHLTECRCGRRAA